MALDRRVTELVRKLGPADLRQLVILARGLIEAQDPAGAQFDDAAGEPTVKFRQQTVRCGKEGCGGCPHGPYWYAYWREGGRVRTRYIGKERPGGA